MRRRILALATFIAVLATFLTAVVGPAAARPGSSPSAATVPVDPPPLLPLPPEFDPGFYQQPAGKVAAAKPGEILAARRVVPAYFALLPFQVDAWQVAYRSNNSRGEAISAVTTLLKPRGKSSRPRKLVSFQMAEDGTAGYCSPSYAIQFLNLSQNMGAGNIPPGLEVLFMQMLLDQGYAVSLPDHEGPQFAYGAGPLAGRIVLDGLRAAKNFTRLEVTDESRIGMIGYSGGAIATGHAAELKEWYAPELNIVGAAQGGVPADLGSLLKFNNFSITTALTLGAVIGVGREYPYFQQYLNRNLNDAGKALLTVKSWLCVQHQSWTFPFLDVRWLMKPGVDPFNDPEIRRLVSDTKMGKSTPDMPIYMWNSVNDEIVPIGQVDRLRNTYCRDKDASVTYTRDIASEHIIADVVGNPLALMWLKDRLDGKPVRKGCSTRTVSSMSSMKGWWPAFQKVVNANIAAALQREIGRGK